MIQVMNKGSILVVEDDEVLAGVVHRILAGQGHDVRLAASAGEARKLARDDRPHIALLDLCLPDGDGVSLGNELSRRDSDLQTILMTAYPVRLLDAPNGLLGFARILTKPLDLTELRGAVAEILALHDWQTQPCEQPLMDRS